MNKVTHFEIPSSDKAKSTQFYEALFGWKINDVPVEMAGGQGSYTTATTTNTDPETMAPTDPGAINGAIVDRSDKLKAPVITVTVDSITEELDKVPEIGGKVVSGKEEIKGMGSYAYIEDPSGNVIGLWQDAPKPAAA